MGTRRRRPKMGLRRAAEQGKMIPAVTPVMTEVTGAVGGRGCRWRWSSTMASLGEGKLRMWMGAKEGLGGLAMLSRCRRREQGGERWSEWGKLMSSVELANGGGGGA